MALLDSAIRTDVENPRVVRENQKTMPCGSRMLITQADATEVQVELLWARKRIPRSVMHKVRYQTKCRTQVSGLKEKGEQLVSQATHETGRRNTLGQ
jgi:hypothetical protein